MSEVRTVLETRRLTLRELQASDLDCVTGMLSDPEAMHFFGTVYTREQSVTWIARQQERYAIDGYGYWLAIERDTGEPVGQMGVVQAEVDGVSEPSLGYIVQRAHWRRGLASEAAASCRDWVFDRQPVSRVITLVRPENLPSLAVARRIGLEIERRTIFARYEHFVLSMSRTAWEQRQASELGR